MMDSRQNGAERYPDLAAGSIIAIDEKPAWLLYQ